MREFVTSRYLESETSIKEMSIRFAVPTSNIYKKQTFSQQSKPHPLG